MMKTLIVLSLSLTSVSAAGHPAVGEPKHFDTAQQRVSRIALAASRDATLLAWIEGSTVRATSGATPSLC